MQEIRKIRRENTEKEARRKLMYEDEREEKELRSYVAKSITAEMVSALPGAIPQPQPAQQGEEFKAVEARQSGAAAWIGERGEGGMGRPGPDQRRDGR